MRGGPVGVAGVVDLVGGVEVATVEINGAVSFGAAELDDDFGCSVADFLSFFR